MSVDLKLQTPRLTLVPLSAAQLRLALQDVNLLAKDIVLPLVPGLVTPPVRRAITMKLAKISNAPPVDLPWYTYWLIIVEQDGVRTGAGMVGFKGVPDDAGSVEIGYGIDSAFRGKGYMTEAVQAMIDWAFHRDGWQMVTACGVLKTNPASSHVLLNAGMVLSGEDRESFCYKITRESWEKAKY